MPASSLIQKILYAWGGIAVRHSRRVLLAAGLLALAASPFVWRALTHVDVNLFNQASSELKRFHLLREMSELFGGDILAAVVTIPDGHSNQDVKALKNFGLLLTTELEKVGTLDEDRAALSTVLRERIDALNKRAMHNKDEAERPQGWLRNVECRTGQGIESALKTLARQRPYLLLEPADVDAIKKLFEPQALEESMERIAKIIPELPSPSAEKTKIYEDPLGIFEYGKKAVGERMKKRLPPLAQDADGFFLSADGTTLVVLARGTLPSNQLDFNRALMNAAQRAENRAISAFKKITPELSVGLKGAAFGRLAEGETLGRLQSGFTGIPAITVENELTLKWDMLLNTGTSLLGVLILFLVVYRSGILTWKVTWTTVFTIWLTVAFAGATRGSLSLLGGAFTAVPVGLGTDYAILLFNTFQNLRAEKNLSVEAALSQALAQCGPGILTAACITALAFFGVGFTHLTGLAEFGILGGVSALIGCAVMLLVLPASLALWSDAKVSISKQVRTGLSFGIPTLGIWLEKKSARTCALIFSALILVGGIALIKLGPDQGPETIAGVRFDPELGNLRSVNTHAIPLRERIVKRFNVGLADIGILVEADTDEAAFETLEQVHSRVESFVARGELKANGSALDLILSPKRQRENIEALRHFDVDEAIKNFQAAAQKRFGIKGAAFFNPFLRHLRDFKLLALNPQPLTLAEVMNGPLGNVLAPYVNLNVSGGVRLRSSWLPRDASQSAAWYAALAGAVEGDAVQKASVRITAAKMVGFELKASTLRDCGWITLVVALGVALSLAMALRSLSACLLALIPLIFAYLWMLAGVPISQLLGWEYSLNFVNLIMFPLLLGSAVDYGVYMVFAFTDGRNVSIAELMAQTGRSVLYCMGTTLIGFGSFVTSSYSGLASLGVASLWGYAGAAFGALFVLPALLGFMVNSKFRNSK